MILYLEIRGEIMKFTKEGFFGLIFLVALAIIAIIWAVNYIIEHIWYFAAAIVVIVIIVILICIYWHRETVGR